jgi:peptide/nickel transport system substrate-binding protein
MAIWRNTSNRLQGWAGAMGLCLALCLAVLTPAIACAAPRESVLVIGVGRDLFDGPDSRTYVHGSTNTWEALTYLGPNLRAQPWLAESWQSQDEGRTWIFRLRPGVRFHDGSPLTSQQAVASIKRIMSRPKYDPTGIYREVISVEPKGSRDIVFRLANPSPAFPNLVAYYSSPIIHPSCFYEDGRLRSLIATGPFRLKQIRRGESIELEAFERYWGERPHYSKVVFRFIPDAQTRLMALMAGKVDAVADVGAILPQQAEDIESAPHLTLLRQNVATTHYLLFNCRRAPFNRADARHWLASILDREELLHAFAKGAGVLAKDPYSSLAKDWSFGALKIKRGLKPGGHDVNLVILLHGGTIQRWPYLEIAQVLQERLANNGLRARIDIKEPGAYYEALQRGQFDLAIQPNTLMTGDPDFFYSYYLASDGPRSFSCGNGEMDRLIREARCQMDPAKRRELYRRLANIFSRQLPLLPLYHDVSLYAYGSRVAGFYMDHNFRPRLDRARPRTDQ